MNKKPTYKRMNLIDFLKILHRADLGNGRKFSYERIVNALFLHYARESEYADRSQFRYHAERCARIRDVFETALDERGYFDCEII